MKVSSGNGQTYTRPTTGGTARSLTPVGTFRIERRIAGVRESSAGLGTLYDPMYFHGGFAIHGSNSVPAWPASHGCIRVARADAIWLFHRVPDGTPVLIHGGQHVFVPR
jgi:lipoprotein-anchoring transpeptidase ErfK/SrfK